MQSAEHIRMPDATLSPLCRHRESSIPCLNIRSGRLFLQRCLVSAHGLFRCTLAPSQLRRPESGAPYSGLTMHSRARLESCSHIEASQ